ncbi:MAG: hypothetical protein ACRD5G_13955 [Candidatus Acidiferrales bacterium]
MTDFFFATPWPGVIAWSALYISDYALTLKCARLYRSGVADKLVFEGSYELNPIFQEDIDSLRAFSPNFLWWLALTVGAVFLFWWAGSQSGPEVYSILLGTMILLELAVHVRHVHNWFLFHEILAGAGVRGRIEYTRPLILRLSSFDLYVFSGFFGLLFAITLHWFFLGGALGCLAAGNQDRHLARKQAGAPKATQDA